MKQLPLDSEYRRRWEKYFLEDGTILDSREVNWRNVQNWDEVARIIAHVQNEAHEFDFRDQPGFVGYMRFRWHGKIAQFDEDGHFTGHKDVHEWAYGWTDGSTAHMTDIDFRTGKRVREYTMPLEEIRGHIHPAIADKCEVQPLCL